MSRAMPSRRSRTARGMRRAAPVSLALVVGAAFAAGCGGDAADAGRPAPQAPAAGTYVAHVRGSDAYVAVLVDADRAAGYLCDRGAVSAWFAARRHDRGRVRLTSRTGAARLALSPGGGATLSARVTLPDGRRRAVRLERARGDAGLYRATASTRGGGLEAGWIVLGDGTQRGNSTMGTEATAVPRLDTATGTVKWAVPGAGVTSVRKLTEPGFMGAGVDL